MCMTLQQLMSTGRYDIPQQLLLYRSLGVLNQVMCETSGSFVCATGYI